MASVVKYEAEAGRASPSARFPPPRVAPPAGSPPPLPEDLVAPRMASWNLGLLAA